MTTATAERAAEGVAQREAEAARLEDEMAQVVGTLNAATGRQVALIARHAPAEADSEVAAFAREATVSQLRKVLSEYTWRPEPDEPSPEPEPKRQVGFGHRDDGWWRQSAAGPPTRGHWCSGPSTPPTRPCSTRPKGPSGPTEREGAAGEPLDPHWVYFNEAPATD